MKSVANTTHKTGFLVWVYLPPLGGFRRGRVTLRRKGGRVERGFFQKRVGSSSPRVEIPPEGGIDPLLHHPGSVQSESAHPDQLNSQHSQLASEIICSAPRLPPPKQWRANTPLMHAPFKDHQQVTKSHLL